MAGLYSDKDYSTHAVRVLTGSWALVQVFPSVASVIKELLENALDAKATSIEVLTPSAHQHHHHHHSLPVACQ